MPTPIPYGAWPSPLTAALVASGARGITDVVVDERAVYWGETRPDEGGRVTIMRCAFGRLGAEGGAVELLPAPWNARTRVHEYGGAAFTVAGGTVYFSNFADQRLYRLPVAAGEGDRGDHGGDTGDGARRAAPEPLTPAGPWRYADAVLDGARRRLVRARGRSPEAADGTGQPRNEVVAIDLATGEARVLS
ncbi:MAG: hypothetical protein U0470_06605 [Anaerolineae bacterium]